MQSANEKGNCHPALLSNNNSNNNNNNKNNNNNNNNNNQFSLYPVTEDEVQESIKGINGGLNE